MHETILREEEEQCADVKPTVWDERFGPDTRSTERFVVYITDQNGKTHFMNVHTRKDLAELELEETLESPRAQAGELSSVIIYDRCTGEELPSSTSVDREEK